MEEKERYEVISPNLNGYAYIHDFKTDNVLNTYDSCDLLNQQDKRIKELEEELAKQKEKYDKLYGCYKKTSNEDLYDKYRLAEETQQLKQQLHDLPKKIVKEIRDDLLDFSNGWWRYFMTDGCEYMLSSDLQGCLDEIIDTILKKYGGGR